MNEILQRLFDGYVWKARILVAVLVAFPVLAILPLLTRLAGSDGNPWLVNPLVGAAVVAVGALVVRRFGVTAEKALKAEWGEFPTTTVMRWRDTNRSTAWKERMHALVPERLGIALSSREEEATDPDEADRRIRDAFDRIRHAIWGKKELPSHAANVDYGFARNLYGCQWLWLGLSAMCSVASLLVPMVTNSQMSRLPVVLCLSATVIVPILERLAVKPQVTHCALRYAEHAWEHLEKM